MAQLQEMLWLARELPPRQLLSNVILIAMTGYGREEDRQRAFSAGFDHHLIKPIDTLKLHEYLNQPKHMN